VSPRHGFHRRRLALGFGGGEVIPTGNAKETVKRSPQGALYALVNLGVLPELRFNFGYQRFNFKQQVLSSLGVPTAVDAHNNVLAGTVGLRINLLHTPVRPYLTAGLGAFDIKTVIDTSRTGSTSSTGSRTNSTGVKFGIDGGAGISADIGRVETFIEGRVQNVYTDQGFITGAKQISAVPVSIGVLFTVF
jgi:hypothetical protein